MRGECEACDDVFIQHIRHAAGGEPVRAVGGDEAIEDISAAREF